MSKLRLTSYDGKEFNLNITQFRSPMNASVNSVQTRKMIQHFPIRCGQPDINFTVQYPSLKDKHTFEAFVRKHQITMQVEEDTEVNLWWPERNIENWTGYITTYTISERRFETAPSATFGVSLIESMMSEKTTIASRSADVWKLLGVQIPAYQGFQDTIIIPPIFSNARARPVNPQDSRVPSSPPPINSGDAPNA